MERMADAKKRVGARLPGPSDRKLGAAAPASPSPPTTLAELRARKEARERAAAASASAVAGGGASGRASQFSSWPAACVSVMMPDGTWGVWQPRPGRRPEPRVHPLGPLMHFEPRPAVATATTPAGPAADADAGAAAEAEAKLSPILGAADVRGLKPEAIMATAISATPAPPGPLRVLQNAHRDLLRALSEPTAALKELPRREAHTARRPLAPSSLARPPSCIP